MLYRAKASLCFFNIIREKLYFAHRLLSNWISIQQGKITVEQIQRQRLKLLFQITGSRPTKLVSSPTKLVSSPTKLVSSPTNLGSSPTKLVSSPTNLGSLESVQTKRVDRPSFYDGHKSRQRFPPQLISPHLPKPNLHILINTSFLARIPVRIQIVLRRGEEFVAIRDFPTRLAPDDQLPSGESRVEI